jgi:multimeric flavodoxin WrbA
VKRLLAISTTTHDVKLSTSVAMLNAVIVRARQVEPGLEVKAINANDLHIVKNLSCYANGKRDCANPESGQYRCWAQYESAKDPAKFGGVDQMPVIYDGLAWADTVLWGTSTRWGSHSALMQTILERMDTLENRAASWGERNPLCGKKAGVVVAGLHWKTGDVASHLMQVLGWYGFTVEPEAHLVWQRSNNPCFEHNGPDKPSVERWLRTSEGVLAVDRLVDALRG